MSGQRTTSMLLLALAALLAGAGVFYHFVVATPRRERARLELEQRQLAESQQAQARYLEQLEKEKAFARGLLLQLCLQEAAAAGRQEWDAACRERSLPAECTLPPPLAATLDENATWRRARCFEQYPPPR